MNQDEMDNERAAKFVQDHAMGVQRLKDQLLICLVKRAGGRVEIPVSEVDDTGQDLLSMEVDHSLRSFTLVASKKS